MLQLPIAAHTCHPEPASRHPQAVPGCHPEGALATEGSQFCTTEILRDAQNDSSPLPACDRNQLLRPTRPVMASRLAQARFHQTASAEPHVHADDEPIQARPETCPRASICGPNFRRSV